MITVWFISWEGNKSRCFSGSRALIKPSGFLFQPPQHCHDHCSEKHRQLAAGFHVFSRKISFWCQVTERLRVLLTCSFLVPTFIFSQTTGGVREIESLRKQIY